MPEKPLVSLHHWLVTGLKFEIDKIQAATFDIKNP